MEKVSFRTAKETRTSIFISERRIDRFYVYGITAFFSVFAYVWLLIILQVTSPGVVDLWEALVTLLMFPLLVGVAYLADREMLCGQTKSDSDDGMFLA